MLGSILETARALRKLMHASGRHLLCRGCLGPLGPGAEAGLCAGLGWSSFRSGGVRAAPSPTRRKQPVRIPWAGVAGTHSGTIVGVALPLGPCSCQGSRQGNWAGGRPSLAGLRARRCLSSPLRWNSSRWSRRLSTAIGGVVSISRKISRRKLQRVCRDRSCEPCARTGGSGVRRARRPATVADCREQRSPCARKPPSGIGACCWWTMSGRLEPVCSAAPKH
jgi:hypothetical protein